MPDISPGKLKKNGLTTVSVCSPAQVEEVFHRFFLQNPSPKGELHYTNRFTLLVAVVLSARATDKSVNHATEKLFRKADSPAAILALGQEKITQYIRTIGLWRSKLRYIIELSEILLRDFEGQVPCSREALSTLPGVGRKTANVVLNTAFGLPVIAVDTHVFRLANRIGLTSGKTPRAVEEGLEQIIPERYKHNAHHWLVLHGRYICKARKPECAGCTLKDLCQFVQKRASIS